MAGTCVDTKEVQSEFNTLSEQLKSNDDIKSLLSEGYDILKKVKCSSERLYQKFKKEYDDLYIQIKSSYENDKQFSIDERNQIRKELDDMVKLSNIESIDDKTKTQDVEYILELLDTPNFPKNTHFEYFDTPLNISETIVNLSGKELVKLYDVGGVPNFTNGMLIYLNSDNSLENQEILKIFVEKVKPLKPGMAQIFERNPFNAEKIPEFENFDSLLKSGNLKKIYKDILEKAGSEGMSKTPEFEEIVNKVVDYINNDPNLKISNDFIEILKFLNKGKITHISLANKMQDFLINELKEGKKIIGNTYLLSYSIKCGFELDSGKIQKEFKNIDEYVKKLGVEEIINGKNTENRSNIGYFAHFLSIIKGYVNNEQKTKIDKYIDGLYKVNYDLTSIGSSENFLAKLNNSSLLKEKLTQEQFKNIKKNNIGDFIESMKPYLKKNLDANKFDELLYFFNQIIIADRNENIGKLSEKEKDILEVGNILSKDINGNYNIDNKFFRDIIDDFDKKSKENKKVDLKSLISEKLKERGLKVNDKLISFVEKEVEIERKLIEIKKIKENPELKEIYISYANGSISKANFEKAKNEIEEKINSTQNINREENMLFNSIGYTKNGGGNYEISTGREGEKLELSLSEFDRLKDNKDALNLVIDFYIGLKDDGLDFVWKYRDFFFKSIKNFNLNGGIKENDALSIYNLIGKQIGLKWEKLDDSKKYFRDLNSKGGMINGEFVEPVTTKLVSSDTSTIFNYLKNKLGRFDEKNNLLETTW